MLQLPEDIQKRSQILDLTLNQQKALYHWLESVIADQEAEYEIPTKTGREVMEQRRIGKVTYQREKVRCGKERCRSCPHGPYWYSYSWNGKKVVSKYVGKELTPSVTLSS